ncbi:MAG: TIGR02453 family protein [Acidobacteriaceae bacterium]|nr:TIGR02453 family protein [Acidobacteriaceae bacterium]
MKSRANAAGAPPGAAADFHGFPEEGFRFLRQLKQHNDRDWFRERKTGYEQHVEQPMRALVLAVARQCQARGLPLHAKDKHPVMRVYRDIRFSKDKRPFKTHVSAELRRSFSDCGNMLYIHVSPDESFVAAGVWRPERPLLHAWRQAIVNGPARFEKICTALAKRGLELNREHSLSSMPRGFQNYSQESFGPWLKLTSFVVHRRFERSDCMTPEFLKSVVDFAMSVKPLLDFGWRVEEAHTERSKKVIPEAEFFF